MGLLPAHSNFRGNEKPEGESGYVMSRVEYHVDDVIVDQQGVNVIADDTHPHLRHFDTSTRR